ncbi:M20/M25/M40 family metallo-hydrolase [Bacteroides sp. OttesenSCG-928-D19]|nr:M20/M25/M40 family metallo-hydrolase [Bacteroides sp. OttesenSCG-928-D19]
MRKAGYTLLISFICHVVLAQSAVDKGLQSINRGTAEAYIAFLASDELEGREAGTRGGRIAGEYIISCLKAIGVPAYMESGYSQPFEVLSRKKVITDSIVMDTDSILRFEKIIPVTLSLNNILGMIPGRKIDEFVIVGAHYDHLGMDANLHGDRIYNGADDNASGVSAVLQIAKAFVESGVKPERNVIFAFWDGEEKRTLGSNFFVETFRDLSKIKTYMNFDMIGRNTDETQPNHVVYFYTDTHPRYGEWLKEDIKKHKLALTPDYRAWDKPVSGSDNASFARHHIPIIWYHTDGHPDYHKPSDHFDKLNWGKLIEITKTAYLIMWRLATEDVSPG